MITMAKYKATCLFLFLTISLVHTNPIVNTKYGPIEGISVPIHTGQIIDSYMAVPYARPPVGDLRFRPPEEPLPWEDTLLAHEPGNACVQDKANIILVSHWQWEKFDEDCLTVNIYTPQTNSTELMPVLVYIHGGGFSNGANFAFPGYFQAASDVVVVTINYRLNIFGFATTEDEVMPGNLGMFDQSLALRFIQENIAAFRGDPSRVTISGESAGGGSVGLHILSPVSEGLFHQAILMSGNELSVWVLQPPEEQPSNYLKQIATMFDCPTSPSAEMVDCLRTIHAQELVRATKDLNCTEGYPCGNFRPVIDGVFLTDYPEVLRNNGNCNRVPEMIGLTEDDGSLGFLGQNYSEGVSREEMDERIATDIASIAPKWPDPSREQDAVEAIRFQYTDWPYVDDPIQNRYMLAKMYGDSFLGHCSNRQAKIHSIDSSVFFYVWNYREENNDLLPEYYGAFHTSELPFTMGEVWIWAEENEAAYNHSQYSARNGTEYERTEIDQHVADFMTTLWTNFAKYGNPTPQPVGVEGSTQITWPMFDTFNFTYANLGYAPYVGSSYRQKEFAFWEYYFNYISYGETFELESELS